MLKDFKLNIALRVVIILLLSFGLAWVFANKDWFFTPLVLGISLVVTVWSLIHYVEKTSRDLSLFLLNIKQGGYRSSFKNKNDSNQSLYKVFDDVIEEFHRVTLEKESHFLYLQTLNENIGVGLISFDESGKIDLMNPIAKSLLQQPNLLKIDQLNSIDKDLYKTISELKSGQRRLMKLVIGNELLELSIQSKKFMVQDKNFTLLMLQDINREMEQKELDAWQRLIRVLTHEIMNSVTPISSLSEALNKHLSETDIAKLSADDQQDIKKSIETIEMRSKGLMRFVQAYKEYSKSPEINFSKVSVADLLDRIEELLQQDFEERGVTLNVKVDSKLTIWADRDLIEQIIINLIKNALDALESIEKGEIIIQAEKNQNNSYVVVMDNGPGIEEEDLEKIFVPFYTTKRHGTGVGLAFARKMMRLHDGQVKVSSRKGEGTKFSLIF